MSDSPPEAATFARLTASTHDAVPTAPDAALALATMAGRCKSGIADLQSCAELLTAARGAMVDRKAAACARVDAAVAALKAAVDEQAELLKAELNKQLSSAVKVLDAQSDEYSVSIGQLSVAAAVCEAAATLNGGAARDGELACAFI